MATLLLTDNPETLLIDRLMAITDVTAKQLKTHRHLTFDDLLSFCTAVTNYPAAKRIRRYSSLGFVPNSYKYRCNIQYVELQGNTITVTYTDAKRSHGKGNLLVII